METNIEEKYLGNALGGWLGVEKNKLKLQTDVNA